MIHFSIFSIAIETVIGISNSMSSAMSNLLLITAMVGFFKSLVEQLRVCFYLVKNKNNQSAAFVVMIVPMMFIFVILLISSMGMSHFLTTNHIYDTIPRITNLASTFLFKIESAVLSIIFLIQIKKIIEISKMEPKEVIIGFGAQIIIASVSLLMVFLSFLSFDVFQVLLQLPQIIIRIYIYGVYMMVVSVVAGSISLALYKTFGDKKSAGYIQSDPWEIQDEKKITKHNQIAFKQNKKIAKNYIMGNSKHYIFGIFSLWALTFFLGYHFRFSDGQEGVGNILMMASLIYIPYLIINISYSKNKSKRKAYKQIINCNNPKKYTALFVEEVVNSSHANSNNISTKHFTYTLNSNNTQLIIKDDSLNYTRRL